MSRIGPHPITDADPEKYLHDHFQGSAEEIVFLTPSILMWTMFEGTRESKVKVELNAKQDKYGVKDNYESLGYSGRFSQVRYPDGRSGNDKVPARDEDIVGMVFAARLFANAAAQDLIQTSAIHELEERAARTAGFLELIREA